MNIEQERAEFEAWVKSLPRGRRYCLITYEHEGRRYYDDTYTSIAFEAFIAGRAALQSQDREDESCKWHNYPETDNVWDTDCGQSFEIYDGTPTENGMGFCCYCGKPIREAIDHARRVEGEGE